MELRQKLTFKDKTVVKNIIFDIGNVLVAFGYEAYFKKFGIEGDMLKRIIRATVGNEAWNEIDRGVLTEEDVLNEFIKFDPEIEKELRMVYEDFNGLLVQFDYTRDWIRELKAAGYKVFCLSNMSTKALRECAEVFDFISDLDGHVYSCDVKLCKPDREIYELIMEKYSLVPEETVFVDDLAVNVDAAKACGMKGIVFQNKEKATEELKLLAAD